MKAIIWTDYGSPDVLQLQEIAKPTPKDNELLIKVHATTVTTGDCEIRSSKIAPFLWLPLRLYLGLLKPRIKILGQELAGEIESVGKDVTQFKQGDAIFATTSMEFGAYAEYICLPESGGENVIALKPANISYEEAAAVPTWGLTALHFMRKANLQRGETLLINGAAGSIGTFAIQMAKDYGAEVTAVDTTHKLALMREIGADHVIDYTQEDFTKNGKTYDVIFDVVGKASFSGCVKSLNKNGRLLLGNPPLSHMLRSLWVLAGSDKKIVLGASNEKSENLVYLKETIEAGKLKTWIDRVYPLEEIPDAHRYVDSGQKQGNVIIRVGHPA